MTNDERAIREADLLAPLHSIERRTFISARGAVLIDERGNEYVDLNEMCKVLGQGNAAFIRAVTAALDTANCNKIGFSAPKERLYRYLLESTGKAFSAIHLCSSGSESVEWAVRIARRMTGRSEVISFWNSIHGRTLLTASMSGLPRRKAGYGPLAQGLVFTPYPRCSECLEQEKCHAGTFPCIQRMEREIAYSSAQDLAAIIIEPYQGADIALPPPGYLRALCEWAHSRGILFIMDEVQSGMGRTGELYCYQREGVRPDMLLLGKALGNGLHISALLLREKPDPEALPAIAGSTGDETVACAAACEVFRQLKDGLLEHIRAVGEILAAGLQRLEGYVRVHHIRALGLAAAIEFHTENDAVATSRRLLDKGYFTGCTGRSVFIKPPYVITQEQIGRFLVALEAIVSDPAN